MDPSSATPKSLVAIEQQIEQLAKLRSAADTSSNKTEIWSLVKYASMELEVLSRVHPKYASDFSAIKGQLESYKEKSFFAINPSNKIIGRIKSIATEICSKSTPESIQESNNIYGTEKIKSIKDEIETDDDFLKGPKANITEALDRRKHPGAIVFRHPKEDELKLLEARNLQNCYFITYKIALIRGDPREKGKNFIQVTQEGIYLLNDKLEREERFDTLGELKNGISDRYGDQNQRKIIY